MRLVRILITGKGTTLTIGFIKRTTILARIEKITDEMWTILNNKHKLLWIAYELDRNSIEVISFHVGGMSILLVCILK